MGNNADVLIIGSGMRDFPLLGRYNANLLTFTASFELADYVLKNKDINF